jgi:SAM-dependent methyltransferase
MLSKRLAVTMLATACACSGNVLMAQDQRPQGGGTAAPHQHMEHRFDDAERYAKSFDDPARDAWQMPGRVVDALDIRAGQLVADIGAGTGYFTVRLAKSAAAPTVYAVDIEQSMVDYVRQRAAKEGLNNVVPVLAAADRTNLSQAVDLVLIVDTYHHIPNRAAYFRELRKSMKPGARLAIIDFRRDSPEGPPVEFRFTPGQVEAELGPAGFRVVARHDFLPRQYFLVLQASNP